MLRFLASCTLIFSITLVSARSSRFTRQADETLTDSEGSGLQFINFDEGSASNPIIARDQEGSGQMYDEEGSGNTLLFDSETPIQVMNVTGTEAEPTDSKVFNQSINITDSDVETLVIKVHLPQKTTSQLLDDLKDDTAQQTNPINTLDTAVSLTSMLNELLGKIQDATTQ
ncbi:Chondroitin ProteoGlycan [Caenorhabditis elegans]|uniref:Chondroitin ProteoGlycan n=1 Tax=Caenorhabditis elegans TaxID=6239 RepID=Q18642_CAEEL|nr:Chondroitin ProteoGlycan [Caenorhabditis elegans]CCD67372.1 Chondroitin ProteoGlycan [Caenorhabditis elegans]|eukprot:NP_500854.1 Uncharacterized protein CELE_C45E5.4 [Caenorhabditis elegans]